MAQKLPNTFGHLIFDKVKPQCDSKNPNLGQKLFSEAAKIEKNSPNMVTLCKLLGWATAKRKPLNLAKN